jgi:hypothetical protein
MERRRREAKVMPESSTADPRVSMLARELRRLRSAKEPFSAIKLADYPPLVSITGEGDVPDAAGWLQDYAAFAGRGNKFVRCAADSIFGDGDDVLARLTSAGNVWDVDQRTARTWSDKGIPLLAQAFVRASDLSSTEGITENTVFVGADEDGLHLRIAALFDAALDHPDPYIAYHHDLTAADDGFDEFVMEPTEIGNPRIEPGSENGHEYRRAIYEVRLPHPRFHQWQAVSILFRERAVPYVRIAGIAQPQDYLISILMHRQFVTLEFQEGGSAELLQRKFLI